MARDIKAEALKIAEEAKLDIREAVRECIERRAWRIVHKINENWRLPEPFRCYVAGGCLGEEINDVDLFPQEAGDIPEPDGLELVSRTKNARTYLADPWAIQLCSYRKASLEELVCSFDFAHIQTGADVSLGADRPEVHRVYFTGSFIVARATHSSWFCGSEYPLSSVLRAGKYFKSGAIYRPTYIRAVISAMTAAVRRGFTNWDDFKDQVDAIDLGLLNDEQQEVGRANLQELFESLRKDR